ncbi:putative F-box domain, leucine-rich repeat domain superfamily, F-box-like domain superfamily [Helianthus debilis subsp. tardiflorus]
MDSRCDIKKMNVEGDRLSSLPDDLIHKILSFVSIKHAVETSVLSSRWRFIWTLMPYLNFFSEEFPSLPEFSKAVTSVLSGRNDQIEVASLMLSLHEGVSRGFAKRIMNYAFAHNVQDMTITCLIEKKIRFPLSLFRSWSLKHLTLLGSIDRSVAPTWELPALTTLHLGYVTLYDEDEDEDEEEEEEEEEEEVVDDDDDNNNIISMCPNLKILTLDGCKIMGSIGFSICHPQLSNLTLKNGGWGWNLFHVDVPQLKNLTIVNCDWVHLSTPQLTSFIYRSGYSLNFSTDNLSSLEEVDLCIHKPHEIEAHAIVGRLQQFHNVKYLTLNTEILEVLSYSMELISNQPSPFANLRSLKIHPVNIQLAGQAQKKVVVSDLVKNYLLDCSPSAMFTMITREEIKASDATLAQHLMAELRMKLERDKANINWADMEQRKEPIKNYREDLTKQSQRETKKICDIISKLQRIEGLQTKLPTSKRAKMQLVFDSLCAEANYVIKKIDRSNTQGSLLSVCSDALAKAL